MIKTEFYELLCTVGGKDMHLFTQSKKNAYDLFVVAESFQAFKVMIESEMPLNCDYPEALYDWEEMTDDYTIAAKVVTERLASTNAVDEIRNNPE